MSLRNTSRERTHKAGADLHLRTTHTVSPERASPTRHMATLQSPLRASTLQPPQKEGSTADYNIFLEQIQEENPLISMYKKMYIDSSDIYIPASLDGFFRSNADRLLQFLWSSFIIEGKIRMEAMKNMGLSEVQTLDIRTFLNEEQMKKLKKFQPETNQDYQFYLKSKQRFIVDLERICYEFMTQVVAEQQALRLQFIDGRGEDVDDEDINSLRYYQLLLKNLSARAFMEEAHFRTSIPDKSFDISLRSETQSPEPSRPGSPTRRTMMGGSKSPGRSSMMSLMNQQMNEKVITSLREELGVAQHKIEDVRVNYTKELNQLHNQLAFIQGKHAKLQPNQYKYIEVKYFDPTDLIPQKYLEQLNYKLSRIRMRYEESLVNLEQHNERLNDQIMCFRKLDKLGNVGISFDEMNCDDVVRKLALIERNAEKIWRAFSLHYNKAFFYDQIEQEFGITPQTHDMLIEQFDKKVNDYKEKAQVQIDIITKKCDEENKRLEKVIKEKEIQMQDLKVEMEKQVLKQKFQIKEEAKFKLQQELANMNKLFDEEKQELYTELRILKNDAKQYEKIKDTYDIASFYQKWVFIAKILKVKETSAENRNQVVSDFQHKFFKREMDRLSKQTGATALLKEDLTSARQENNELCLKLSQSEYQIYTLTAENDGFKEQIEDMKIEVENLNNKLFAATKERDMYRNECTSFKQSYEQSQDYIHVLEAQNDHLKEKIERLNRIAKRFDEKQEKTENTLSYANKGTKQALHQLHKDVKSKHDRIYGKKTTQDVGTLTQLFGLNKTFENTVKAKTVIPKMHRVTQTEKVILKEQECQVEAGSSTLKNALNPPRKTSSHYRRRQGSKYTRRSKEGEQSNSNLRSGSDDSSPHARFKSRDLENLSFDSKGSRGHQIIVEEGESPPNERYDEFRGYDESQGSRNAVATGVDGTEDVRGKGHSETMLPHRRKLVRKKKKLVKPKEPEIIVEPPAPRFPLSQPMAKKNIFSQTQLEQILSKSLRVNISKKDAQVQTEGQSELFTIFNEAYASCTSEKKLSELLEKRLKKDLASGFVDIAIDSKESSAFEVEETAPSPQPVSRTLINQRKYLGSPNLMSAGGTLQGSSANDFGDKHGESLMKIKEPSYSFNKHKFQPRFTHSQPKHSPRGSQQKTEQSIEEKDNLKSRSRHDRITHAHNTGSGGGGRMKVFNFPDKSPLAFSSNPELSFYPRTTTNSRVQSKPTIRMKSGRPAKKKDICVKQGAVHGSQNLENSLTLQVNNFQSLETEGKEESAKPQIEGLRLKKDLNTKPQKPAVQGSSRRLINRSINFKSSQELESQYNIGVSDSRQMTSDPSTNLCGVKGGERATAVGNQSTQMSQSNFNKPRRLIDQSEVSNTEDFVSPNTQTATLSQPFNHPLKAGWAPGLRKEQAMSVGLDRVQKKRGNGGVTTSRRGQGGPQLHYYDEDSFEGDFATHQPNTVRTFHTKPPPGNRLDTHLRASLKTNLNQIGHQGQYKSIITIPSSPGLHKKNEKHVDSEPAIHIQRMKQRAFYSSNASKLRTSNQQKALLQTKKRSNLSRSNARVKSPNSQQVLDNPAFISNSSQPELHIIEQSEETLKCRKKENISFILESEDDQKSDIQLSQRKVQLPKPSSVPQSANVNNREKHRSKSNFFNQKLKMNGSDEVLFDQLAYESATQGGNNSKESESMSQQYVVGATLEQRKQFPQFQLEKPHGQ